MKVLLLTQVLPYPPDAGAKVKTWNVLRHLAKRHEVTVVSFVRGDQSADVRELRDHCRAIHTVEMRRSPWRDVATLAGSLTGGVPWLMRRDAQRSMHELVRRLSARERFDVAHADQLNMCQYALPIEGVARLFDAHNALWLLYERLAAQAASGPQQWLWRRESKLLRRYEGEICSRFDSVTAVTAEDREALAQVCGGRADIHVVPITIDTGEGMPVRAATGDGRRIVFVGTMYWPPNADAMLWFVRDVWPILLSKCPTAQLEIIGAKPPRRVAALASDRVRVAGYVADLVPHLERADVFVVPLRAGGGMRVKILEALARGVPVVSTRIGCEGLAVTGGSDVLIADTAPELAAAVLRVLEEPDLAARLRRNGRRLVERLYDAKVALQPLDEVYERLASRGLPGEHRRGGSGAR